MRRKLLPLFCILSILAFGCSTSHSYSTHFLRGDAYSIELQCSGYGTTATKAIADAELNAIQQLLFRGIPQSQQKDPLIEISEKNARQHYRKYLTDLLDNGRFRSFITSSVTVTDATRVIGTQKRIVIDVTFNLRALRSDLEQNHIIRKFGY